MKAIQFISADKCPLKWFSFHRKYSQIHFQLSASKNKIITKETFHSFINYFAPRRTARPKIIFTALSHTTRTSQLPRRETGVVSLSCRIDLTSQSGVVVSRRVFVVVETVCRPIGKFVLEQFRTRNSIPALLTIRSSLSADDQTNSVDPRNFFSRTNVSDGIITQLLEQFDSAFSSCVLAENYNFGEKMTNFLELRSIAGKH